MRNANTLTTDKIVPQQMLDKSRNIRAYNNFVFSLLAILAILVVFISINRRINFDEALAIKSGWLFINGIASEPAFFMPITALFGIIGTLLSDPLYVFICCRLLVLVFVVIALIHLSNSFPLTNHSKMLFFLLIFLNTAYLTHGIEFRYDFAIIIGLIYGLIASLKLTPKYAILLGISIAWLQLHHIKGIYYSGCVLAIAAIINSNIEKPIDIIFRIFSGWLATVSIWFSICALSGNLYNALHVYTDFFNLSNSVQHKLWPNEFNKTFTRDMAWWILVFICILKSLQEGLGKYSKILIAYIAVSFVFFVIHPHQWAYLVTLAIPFAALLIVTTFQNMAPTYVIIICIFSICVQLIQNPEKSYLPTLTRTIASSNENQIETLRYLKLHAETNDTIIDPSGLSYFIQPSTSQWYSDSLFKEAAIKNNWMKDLNEKNVMSTKWIIDSYRLNYLPPNTKNAIENSHRHVYRSIYAKSTLSKRDLTIESHYPIQNFW